MSKRSVAAIEREAAILSAQITVLQRRETEFERVLGDMHSLHDSVQKARLALEVQRKDLDAERLPINWLPVELLVHIFVAYVDDDNLRVEKNQPFYRPPVILSHVCQKWRDIALSTSRLWSRIRCGCASVNPAPLVQFLERSGNTPLDIVYNPSEYQSNGQEDSQRMIYLLLKISDHSPRWQSIVFACRHAETMQRLFNVLQGPSHGFSSLQCLDLAFLSANPSLRNSLLLKDNMAQPSGDPVANPSSGASSNLKRLRLEKVPFLALPVIFFPNLRYLELVGFHLHSWDRDSYSLQMSSLCRLFSHIPQLEELVLLDTIPFFDVIPSLNDGDFDTTTEPADDDAQDSRTADIFVRPVELLSLNRLEWSYSPPGDIHRFLSFLIVPFLEKMELYMGDIPGKRTQGRGINEIDMIIHSSITHRVLHFGSLKELSVQCEDLDTIGSLLRRMACPILEKLEIAGTGMWDHRGVFPVLPRLESIFRDPRLPHLTHLTLSHLDICSEHGRAMLGYMPALTSLSLDACKGVGKLIEYLSDELPKALVMAVSSEGHHYTVSGGVDSNANNSTSSGRRRPRGVRFCPQLESLSLWGCSDVQFSELRTFLTIRNLGDHGTGSDTDVARAAALAGVVIANDGISGRKIKPLRRRLRHRVDDKGGRVTSAAEMAFSREDTRRGVFGTGDVSHVARVRYLRIKGCASITEEDVFWLKELKVEDLEWNAWNA